MSNITSQSELTNSDDDSINNKPTKNRGRAPEGNITRQRKGHKDTPKSHKERSVGPEAERVRQRLAFLCHDLRTFTSNPEAAQRLNTSVYPHFIGPPYLTEEEAQFAIAHDVRTLRGAGSASPPDETAHNVGGSKTLATFLEEGVAALVAARKAKGDGEGRGGRDFVLCTSHDLAPLLQEACGFSKEYFETRAFKDLYQRWGKEVRKANKKGKGAV
ncbi:hypothetical protein C2E23DRAFT_834424 [Lenzites betulinus]|nr:hypothetical protein C2E23DRAFT_834424 [Lenzites betulinus]